MKREIPVRRTGESWVRYREFHRRSDFFPTLVGGIVVTIQSSRFPNRSKPRWNSHVAFCSPPIPTGKSWISSAGQYPHRLFQSFRRSRCECWGAVMEKRKNILKPMFPCERSGMTRTTVATARVLLRRSMEFPDITGLHEVSILSRPLIIRQKDGIQA